MGEYVTLSELAGDETLPCDLEYNGRVIPAEYRPAMVPSTAFTIRARIRRAKTEEDADALVTEMATILATSLTSWKLAEDSGEAMAITVERISRLGAEILTSFTASLIRAGTLKKTTETPSLTPSPRTTSSRTRRYSGNTASRRIRTGSKS